MNEQPERLSPGEQTLLDLIWRHQPVAVSALLDHVNASRPRPITRNTLQTQLTRLEGKGWIRRDDEQPTRRYRACVSESQGRRRLLGEMRRRLFGGSSLSLVRCLVEDETLSDEEVAEIRRLIDSKRKGGSR